MKKLLSLSFASLAFAVMADDFSPNIGVHQFTSVATDSFLLPVKFDSLSASAISPRELVATNGLNVGTTWLYIFQNDAYTSWNLQPTGWVAASTSDSELGTIPADGTVTLAAGSAIWITGVKGKNISIYGKVITSKTSTIVRNKTNLLANPTDATVTGETLATKLSGVAQAKDRITPIDNSFAGYYVCSSTGTWTHYSDSGRTPNATLPNLAANQGFWYVSKSDLQEGKSNEISW